jgi:LPS export ABC transporter protein LptC
VVQTPGVTRLFPGGKKQWKVGAKTLEVNNKTNKGRAEQVTWELMDEKQHPFIKATARAADIDMKTKSIEFIGPVTAKGKKDESARVNKLYFDGPKNRLYGSMGVRITKDKSVLTGRELEVDPENRVFEVRGNVKVIYRGEEKIVSE